MSKWMSTFHHSLLASSATESDFDSTHQWDHRNGRLSRSVCVSPAAFLPVAKPYPDSTPAWSSALT